MDRRLDDTKRSIGVHGLQDTEKKELFAKFQQHGGEVIKEPAPQSQAANRNRQGPIVRRAPSSYGSPDEDDRRSSSNRRDTASSAGNKPGDTRSYFLERTALWFRSVLGGIIKGSGDFLSPGFFTYLHNKAHGNLLNLGLITFPLAHASAELRVQLRDELSRLGTYHFEYLVRLSNIYEEALLGQILNVYDPKHPQKVPLKSVGKPLCELYKRIYIMRNFAQSGFAAAIRALEIQARMDNKDKVILARDISKLKRSMRFIFEELLDKLHLAILNVFKRNLDYGHPDLERFLGITLEDRMGYISEQIAFEPDMLLPEDSDMEGGDEEEGGDDDESEKDNGNTIYVSTLPEHIQAGFTLMREIDFSAEKVFAGQEAPLALIGEENKMYITEILFEILDREYSFVLTSNKIKVALAYQGGERRDVRKLLSDSYFALDETRNNIKDYNRIITERHEIDQSPHLTLLQKSQTLHKLETERSRLDNQIRNHFGQILKGTESALAMLIDDAKGEMHLLQNPEEKLHFVQSGDKKRRLEGCSVIDAIKETYAFVVALQFRLLEGDLAGLGAAIDQVIRFDVSPAGVQPE